MKKIVILAPLSLILIVGGLLTIKNIKKTNITNPQENKNQSTTKEEVDYERVLGSEIDTCKIFPKEKIEEILGKKFITTKGGVNKTSKYSEYYCEYYQEEPKMNYNSGVPAPSKRLSISFIKGEIQSLRDAYKLSNYSVKQDSQIPFPHQLIYDQNGNFRTLEIFLSDNLDLLINIYQSDLTQEQALNFVKNFSLYLKDYLESKQNPKEKKSESVPFPQEEDIIHNFVNLIEEGYPDKAASMIKTSDESELQAWAVNFSNINSFKLISLEKTRENEWIENKHFYKAVFDVWMNPDSANAPIPYYGWQNGKNTRWITLEKDGNTWKITEIATGP